MGDRADSIMIGRTLGRYRITAKLGEGGMGSVWRAEDPALNRTVALKLLSTALWASESARQRFIVEARAVASLSHPGVVGVFDIGETEDPAWVAYQFIEGETVAARIERGPLSPAEARALALDTAEALAHAHAHGVIHRDVTARNVMVTPAGRAVLVDFGLARPERGTYLTTTGVAVGTPGYMAPEVLRGQEADARSDLYGLGMVLYRMLTGRLPFEGGRAETAPLRALEERVPPPSDLRPELPAAFERVVLRLLERAPADRYASAAEVMEALRSLALERAPSRAERARRALARRWRRTGEAMRRWASRKIGVAALAGVALLAAAGWFAAHQGWLPGATRQPPILAVLPFRNETDDPEETSYIADGLAEALTTNLAQTERLRVLPWVTTQRVQTDSTSLPKLAKTLNARKLLLGTMHSTPEGLTVSLSLIDGADGTQIWTRLFEGTADQLPSLEARMLFETTSALLGTLTAAERTRMALPSGRDGRAYNMYLEGASNLSAGDPQSLVIAEQFFKRSLELDSTFADAHVGLGAVYNSRYFMGIEGGAHNYELASEHFQSAARLDPSSPLAMRARLNHYWQQDRYADCLELGQKALRTRPLTLDLRLVAEEAYVLGALPDIGVKLGEEILREDPSNPSARFWVVIGAAWSGQSEKVLEEGAEYIRRFPEYFEVYDWMAGAALRLRQPEKALALARRAAQIEGGAGDSRALLFQAGVEEIALGPTAARASWERLRDLLRQRLILAPDQQRNRTVLMEALVMLGDRGGALREWRTVRRQFESTRHGSKWDFELVPLWLIKLGERDEAQRVQEILDREESILEMPGSIANFEWQMLGVSEDPFVRAVLTRSRERCQALRARFGKP